MGGEPERGREFIFWLFPAPPPTVAAAVMSYVAEALQVIPLPPSEVVLQREGR